MEFDENVDILTLVEQVKNGLTCRATGKAYDNKHYIFARRRILTERKIDHLIPQLIKTCRTVDEFWIFIKQKFPTYEERSKFLSNEFNPLLEHLENTGKSEITDLISQDVFSIGERIGNGGFGVIYKYHHKLADVDFAIKVLDPSFIQEEEKEEYNKRFFREAKILFSLDHPNIVRIYDVGILRTKPAKPFIRMEYINGQNLDDCILRIGPVSFERSIKPIRALLEGLSYAHKKGVIHRDLKPRNYMVTSDGSFKIIDFGISAFLESDLHTKLTKTGELIAGGKYIDPELELKPDLKDMRSDIYSVGAIWYFILTGHAPAGSDMKQALLDTDRVTELQANIILKCLSRDIDNRYKTCDEILALFSQERNDHTDANVIKNTITDVTRRDIIDLFRDRLQEDFESYINNRMSQDKEYSKVFYYYGRLNVIDFLGKLYNLDEMPSYDKRYNCFRDEIIKHTVANDGWDILWVFEDSRLGLIEGDDETLLKFLSYMFHPIVRNEKCNWRSMLNSINSLLENDGYEIYESGKISGRSVFSYRPII